MAGPIEITLDGSEALRTRLQGIGRETPRAITRALNRTITTVQTAVLRALAADTGLAQKDIRTGLSIQRATFSTLQAILRVTGRRLPLLAFQARQTRAGVTYRIGAGGRGSVPSAFLATMRSSHRGVFKRKTARRLPIAELFGPSLPHVARTRVFEAVQAQGAATLEKNLLHEIDFLLSKGAVAGGGDA